MGEDIYSGPTKLHVMERYLVPKVMSRLDEIAATVEKYRKHQEDRLTALRCGDEIPAAAGRACEKYLNRFARLMRGVPLNRLRLEELEVQIAGLWRRLDIGDVAAVVADSRMLPHELARSAAEIGGHRSDREDAEFWVTLPNLGLVISIAREFEQRGPLHELMEAGRDALQQAICDFDLWRWQSFENFASMRIRRAMEHAIGEENRSSMSGAARSSLEEAAMAALANLTPEELSALRERFGAGTISNRLKEEIDRELRVTRKRIQVIEEKAVAKLMGLTKRSQQRPSKTVAGAFTKKSRREEMALFRQIHASRRKLIAAIYECPLTMGAVVHWRECLLQGEMGLRDVIDLQAAFGAYGANDNEIGQNGEDKND